MVGNWLVWRYEYVVVVVVMRFGTLSLFLYISVTTDNSQFIICFGCEKKVGRAVVLGGPF